jgi:nucleoside phosphorylase
MPLVDFAIITGLDEEMGYLRKVIPELVEDNEFGGNEVWYRGRVSTDNNMTYSVVASFQTAMGPQHAHALTAKVIQRWDPAYIILVGIAGSFHKSVRLGHVIVSVQVFYFDPGKVTERGIKYRPEGYPCSATLVRQAQALTQNKAFAAWQREGQDSAQTKAIAAQLKAKQARSQAKKPKARKSKAAKKAIPQRSSSLQELRSHLPKAHFGTVASGSLVITSEKKKEELLALHGKIIGTEMEGAGMLAHTFTHERPTPCIVIKGISDHADPDKSAADEEEYWRELGGENASRFVRALLGRGRIDALHTDEFSLDAAKGSIDQTRRFIPDPGSPGISYLGFPQLVMPNGPITRLSIEAVAKDRAGKQLAVHKLVASYCGIDDKPVTVECRSDAPIALSRLAARPVQLHFLLGGTAETVDFRVRTPAEERTIQWQA